MLNQPSERRFRDAHPALHGVAATSWRRVLIPHTWRFRCGRLARHLRGARCPIRRRIENPGLAAAPPMGHTGCERCAGPGDECRSFKRCTPPPRGRALCAGGAGGDLAQSEPHPVLSRGHVWGMAGV